AGFQPRRGRLPADAATPPDAAGRRRPRGLPNAATPAAAPSSRRRRARPLSARPAAATRGAPSPCGLGRRPTVPTLPPPPTNRAAAPPARICGDHHPGVITAHHRLPAVRVAVSQYPHPSSPAARLQPLLDRASDRRTQRTRVTRASTSYTPARTAAKRTRESH